MAETLNEVEQFQSDIDELVPTKHPLVLALRDRLAPCETGEARRQVADAFGEELGLAWPTIAILCGSIGTMTGLQAALLPTTPTGLPLVPPGILELYQAAQTAYEQSGMSFGAGGDAVIGRWLASSHTLAGSKYAALQVIHQMAGVRRARVEAQAAYEESRREARHGAGTPYFKP